VSDRLSRATKFLYGIGDTGFSLTSTIIDVYFLLFLTDVVRIRPGIAAIAILVGRTWDYINDPLIGYFSDRTRTKWGRRRPFLLFGALPYGLAFVLLWWRPPFESPIALVAYYSLAYIVYELAATFVYMPYFALTPELTGDYDERTALTSYRMFFSIFASLLAFTIPGVIVGGFEPQNAPGVLLMGAIFAALSAAPLWLTFAGTREREQFMQLKQPTLRQSLRSAKQNRPFIFGLIIFLLTWVCVSILSSTLLFFIKYVVEREPQSEMIMGTIFVIAIFTLPLWEWVSRRLGKQKAYIVGIAFWAVVQLALISLNAATPLWVLFTLAGLAGIGVGAAHVLPWSIIPDAIEWDEWQTGERHEGMFYSLITLARKIATSIAVPLVGVVLEITHYNPDLPMQPAAALTGIRIVIGPIPAVLLVGGILFALAYPLSREKFSQIRDELEQRRLARKEPGA
jgi:GPH family glycoside/pentoside/hexuronide:cation symporter